MDETQRGMKGHKDEAQGGMKGDEETKDETPGGMKGHKNETQRRNEGGHEGAMDQAQRGLNRAKGGDMKKRTVGMKEAPGVNG